MESTPAPKEEAANRERNWEQVQIKAFTSWLNSYLDKRGMKLSDLEHDLQDGTLLNHFVEIVTQKKIGKWDLTPSRKVQKLENLSIGLNYIQNDMKIRLVGIGSEDVFNGHLKLILGLVWSLFRGIRLTSLTGGSGEGGKAHKSMEESLLKWVRETVGDLGVAPTDFKYGFRDGQAFAALVSKYDPTLLDFSRVNKDDPGALLAQAFELAEKHMNIPQLLSPSDLTEGDPDERSVQLYVSLFFHAFSSKREKEEMEAANKGIASRLEDLGSRLQREAQEREELLKQKDSLLAEQAGLDSTIGEKGKRALELNEATKKLESEVQELRGQLEELHELKNKDLELASKLATLHDMAERQRASRDESVDASVDALKEQIQRARSEIDALRQRVGGGQDERASASRDLAETQEALAKEAERLRAELAAETAARTARDEKHARLQSEHDLLTKKAAQTSKAGDAWSLLSKNLEEHLEDLYCWREVQTDGESDPTRRIEIKSIVPSISSTKNWNQQATLLVDRLEDENKALLKVLEVKDAIGRRRDAAIKQGWLVKKGQRNTSSWKKRHFVLRTDTLSYYKTDEANADEKASISLATCEIGPESSDNGHDWLLKVVVDGRQLVLEAESKEHRYAWIAAVAGLAAAHVYRKDSDDADSDARPDLRLLSFLGGDANPPTVLHLDDRPLSQEALRALTAVLPYNYHLKILSLENAELEDNDVRRLAPALASLSHLRVLKLGRNKISSAGAAAVAEALPKMKSLEELYLNENEIGDEGADALAQALAHKSSLRVVDLSASKVSDKGAAAIAGALTEEHSLESLILSRNAITDEGAQALAELLRRRTSLKSIHLGGNSISDEGAQAIAAALKENEKVTHIDLSSNKLGNVGASHIRQVLSDNEVLEGINLSENKLQCGADLASFLDVDAFFFPHLAFSRRIGK